MLRSRAAVVLLQAASSLLYPTQTRLAPPSESAPSSFIRLKPESHGDRVSPCTCRIFEIMPRTYGILRQLEISLTQ